MTLIRAHKKVTRNFATLALGFVMALASANLAVADMMRPTNAPPAWDPPFSFTFSIGSNTGIGSIAAIAEPGNIFLATSGTLTVTGGLDANPTTYSLVPGGPPLTTSADGMFTYDDLFSQTDPTVDDSGLLFTGNGLEINIYASGPGMYGFASWNGSFYNVNDAGTGLALSFAETPEPPGIILFGSVLVCLGLKGFRKKTQSQH